MQIIDTIDDVNPTSLRNYATWVREAGRPTAAEILELCAGKIEALEKELRRERTYKAAAEELYPLFVRPAASVNPDAGEFVGDTM